MFKNYFTVAFRNFTRNKVFSSINVLGLSIGISAALVIFLIVYYELSFDKFEKDRDRIYRVVIDLKYNGDEAHGPAVPAPLSTAIHNEMSGVEASVPVMQFQGDATAKVTIASGNSDKSTVIKSQPDIVFTNQQYFELIPFSWLSGSPQTALQEPFSVVITVSRAKQYFPNVALKDIPGKQIVYNDNLQTTVTGIVKDLEEHTDFTSQEFISFSTIAKTALQKNFMMDVWDDWMSYSKVYVKLSKGSSVARTENQLQALIKKYNKNANKDSKNTMAFRLQPLSDIHFNTDYAGFGMRTAHQSTLYGLLAIAGFLLLLGCINFINLTTAQGAQRAKEIGIRKTIGSSRKQLILQFLSETFFITGIATILSVLITPLLLKIFADFIPPGMHFELWHQPSLMIFLFLLTVVVSFLSGLYPALILARFKPISVLKNQSVSASGQSRNSRVRKILTVSQFVIAQFFIIGTLMVSKQINYTLNKNLGFRKEAILNFEMPRDTVMSHPQQMMADIMAIPEIQLASVGFEPPSMEGAAFGNIIYVDGKKEVKENVQVRWGDTNYIKVYAINLVAGRNVRASDSTEEVLINETYAKELGFQSPDKALNKTLMLNRKKSAAIVGVMRDFHEQSLHGIIGPIVFEYSKRADIFHILLKPQNEEGTVWPAAIHKIAKAFKSIYPESDFSYSFFDETIAKFYQTEQQTSGLLQWASGLAIFISCLGLLGLVIYTTNIRTKEIGIRKVFGATVTNIIMVLSKDFVRLVLVAFFIASPIAWWATSKWMENFAYRTSMSWWIFVLSGVLMMLISFGTLSMHIIKAAMANPANSLRTE